jgi:hypothetical protein
MLLHSIEWQDNGELCIWNIMEWLRSSSNLGIDETRHSIAKGISQIWNEMLAIVTVTTCSFQWAESSE